LRPRLGRKLACNATASFTLGLMTEEFELFRGVWGFNPQLSKLSTPSPRSWILEILADSDGIRVQETIVGTDGSETVISVAAKFDGNDYPVEGSPAADTIAYTRLDRKTIRATGKKNGSVSLTETVTVTPEDWNLTLLYSIHAGPEVIAQGIAVFQNIIRPVPAPNTENEY